MLKPLEVLRLYPEHDGTIERAFATRMARDPDRPLLVHGGRTRS